MIRKFEPCLPTTAKTAPLGEQWVHEIKHDGYRLMARRVEDRVSLVTKGGNNWSQRYPRVVAGIAALKVSSVVIDGEVCWLENDKTDFNKLHSRLYDDWATLKTLLKKSSTGIQYVDHLKGDGQIIFEHACRLGLEGIVSKRADSVYRAGSSKAWIKVKNRKHAALFRVMEAFAK